MCKILSFTNTTKIPSKQVPKVIRTIQSLLSETERDGFGFALTTDRGLFIERTTKPSAFSPVRGLPDLVLPYTVQVAESIGIRGKLAGPALFHGRTSTNTKSLINTHPLVKRDWTLIHNGVVSNHGPDYQQVTSNDTEHLLEYLSTTGITGIESHITGYYAVNAIAPDGKLHIFRDSIAPLSIAWIETIETYVIATKEAHITKLCAEFKWKHSKINDVEDNSYLVFELNELVAGQEINPRGRTASETKHSAKSLGYQLDYSEYKSTWEPSQAADVYSITPNGLSEPQYDEAIVSGFEGFEKSEQLFLHETVLESDGSYVFLDYKQNELTRAEFLELDHATKLYCTVVRPDGTIVDPSDYYADPVLYSGRGA